MGVLVAGVELADLQPLAGDAEQVEVAETQQLAPVGRPLLVAVVGEQLTRVSSDRRPRLRVAFGVNADRWLCATVEDLLAKRRLMTEEPVVRLL